MTGTDAPSERTRVQRAPQRAAYDRATIEAILDEGLTCHVGFAVEGQPYVIPTNYGRVGDRLYLHGSSASRMLRSLGASVPVMSFSPPPECSPADPGRGARAGGAMGQSLPEQWP